MVSHRQVAAHLDATGLPVTYLAPALYLEDLLAEAENIRREAVLALPAGHGRAGLVAADDVAAAAAAVLTGSSHEGATYVLTGPQALTFHDVAARISAVFARTVDYTNQAPTKARAAMLASGVSPWQADGNLELFDWIRAGGAATVTASVRELTGAEPRPLEDWLDEERGSFLEPVPGRTTALF
jgi:NAD(P)H dehydrogenase (quinone)